MTRPQIVRNVYCADPEDRVIETRCACCQKCWLFVASRGGLKNGACPFGGPFNGWSDERDPKTAPTLARSATVT